MSTSELPRHVVQSFVMQVVIANGMHTFFNFVRYWILYISGCCHCFAQYTVISRELTCELNLFMHCPKFHNTNTRSTILHWLYPWKAWINPLGCHLYCVQNLIGPRLDRSRTHLFNINCKSFKRRFFGLHNTPVIRKSRVSFECTSINCELTGGLLDLTNYLRPAGIDPDRNTIKII